MTEIITDRVLQALSAHAVEAYPREACGIADEKGYHRQENVAEDPLQHYQMKKGTLARYVIARRPFAVLHSHPDGDPWPGKVDMEAQLGARVPFGVIAVTGDGKVARRVSGLQMWGDQCGVAPLVGRTYVPNVWDCYNLGRDVYKTELGVELKQYPRHPSWWDIEGEEMLTVAMFEDNGFFQIEERDLRPYDAILGTVRGDGKINHVSVYRGDGLMLHHLAGRQSREEPYMPWRRFCRAFLRHESMREARP